MVVAFGLADSSGYQFLPMIIPFNKGVYRKLALANVGHITPLFRYPSNLHKGERVKYKQVERKPQKPIISAK